MGQDGTNNPFSRPELIAALAKLPKKDDGKKKKKGY